MAEYVWWTRVIDGRGVIREYYSSKKPRVESDNIGRIIEWPFAVTERFEEPAKGKKTVHYSECLIKHVDAAAIIDTAQLKVEGRVKELMETLQNQ
jgi:hypothetical protein